MSHFLMGVIIMGSSKKAESYFSVLKNKLTYYDEYLDVPEYEAICKYCNLVDPCLVCSGAGVYKTTRNPNSKLDYWEIGGRWRDKYEGMNLQQEAIEVSKVLELIDLDGGFFGYLLPNNNWVEKGEMGYWGVVIDDISQEEWNKKQKELLEPYKEGYMLIAVDCHI